MAKILLLLESSQLVDSIRRILGSENHTIMTVRVDGSFNKPIPSIQYDLVIIEQGYRLPDGTPVLLTVTKDIKEVWNSYPPIILLVSENFQSHEYYPEADEFITIKAIEKDLASKVNNLLESMKYLKTERGVDRDLEVEEKLGLFDKELALKDRELSSYSILLMKKHNELNFILSFLENITKEHFESDLKILKKEIKQFLGEENFVESFFSYFNRVNPSFSEELDKITFLTLIEKKQCAFIKMGMENKDIATLLSIEPESVRKAHTRLKKKLGLSANDSLKEFLYHLK